jgi:hypothetical protein
VLWFGRQYHLQTGNQRNENFVAQFGYTNSDAARSFWRRYHAGAKNAPDTPRRRFINIASNYIIDG